MIKTFTPNDVLKNQSGELPPEESAHLDASISESPELEDFAESADDLQTKVVDLLSQPSERPLKNIMAFIQNELKENQKS
jgi:hypothetical protein